MSAEGSTSSDGSFDVGAAVIGKLDLTLNNHDGRFDEYDFTGAEVIAYMGATLADGTTEWLRMGTYLVDQPDAYAGTIALTALDGLSLLERPYAEVTTTYPATLERIVREACEACGLTLQELDGSAPPVVESRPDGDHTCLDVVAYAAQAMGCFVRADEWGRVVVRWYETSAYEGEAWLDGQSLDDSTPYASGDSADGGTLDDYSTGSVADGGSFETAAGVAHVWAVSQLAVNTDDVVVTGIRVTAQGEVTADGSRGADGEVVLFGSEGYVLDVSDNPLVQYGHAAEAASRIGARVVGMRFRPLSVTATCDPAVEPGDPVLVTDAKSNSYRAWATTVRLSATGSMSMTCSAESASRNSASSASARTSAIVRARNEVVRERNARQLAMDALNEQLSQSSGLFSTKQSQSDGSYIYYMHDKPTLDASKIVWKATSDAMGVSTDGGKTYATALSATGDALLSRIYAVGINADYINAGTINANMINGGEIKGVNISLKPSPTSEILFSNYGVTMTDPAVGYGVSMDSFGFRVQSGANNVLYQNEPGFLFIGYKQKETNALPKLQAPIMFSPRDTNKRGAYAIMSPNTNGYSFDMDSDTLKMYLKIDTHLGTYAITGWTSDRRDKENIHNSHTNATEIIRKIQHRSFKFKNKKDDKGRILNGQSIECGYIAQEVKEINPAFAFVAGDMNDGGRMQIDETAIIPILSKALQEMDERVLDLEARVAELEKGRN
jgi:hypothetical protein